MALVTPREDSGTWRATLRRHPWPTSSSSEPGSPATPQHSTCPGSSGARAWAVPTRSRSSPRTRTGTGSRPTSGSVSGKHGRRSDVVFPLAPVYAPQGHRLPARPQAVAIWPQGDDGRPARRGRHRLHRPGPWRASRSGCATTTWSTRPGPRLRFEATEGLGPDGPHRLGVHRRARDRGRSTPRARPSRRLRGGRRTQTLVVGIGHGTCTCEGAAFEYVFNVDHELREAGVRDRARLVYLTNEAQLGDFGVGRHDVRGAGLPAPRASCGPRRCSASVGSRRSSVPTWSGSRRASSTTRPSTASTTRSRSTSRCCCRRSAESRCAAYDRDGSDITSRAVRSERFHEGRWRTTRPSPTRSGLRPATGRETYQAPGFDNIFAVGIAFAPPHQISRPRKSRNGTVISAVSTPHRDAVRGDGQDGRAHHRRPDHHGAAEPGARRPRWPTMGAACVASAGAGLRTGIRRRR